MTAPIILVVDDSPVIRRMLTLALEDEGYLVAEACDGDEALEQIRAISPRLVFIDATMPKRDGYQVCQQVRADDGIVDKPYLIMLTAGGQAADRERAEADVDEFMTKPFSPSRVIDRVFQLVGPPG